MKKLILPFLLLLLLAACQAPKEEADLIIYNANIWTGNPEAPSASALVVKDGVLIAVGDDNIGDKYKAAVSEDANGKFVTPGFIDTHVHFLSSSYGLSSVQLRDAKTPEDFINRIKETAESLPEGAWILGGDWDHTLWGGELPRAEWIDSVTQQNPVSINRLDGHMILANSVAIKMAGVDNETPEVEGGAIERIELGYPAGVFKDNAMSYISKVIAEPTPEQDDIAFEQGMKYVASHGVTTIHNMDQASPDIIKKYKRVKDLGITRVYLAVELQYGKELYSIMEQDGAGDEWLKIGVLKGMVDGALGSHTAAFKDPYTDLPGDSGFFVLSEEDLYTRALLADSLGLHLAIHAIGDRAISTLLDVFGELERTNGPRDRRIRVEHAQHMSPEDFERFAELNVIASMQPYHAIDDGRWAEEIIGSERIKTTYAFKSFMDQGVRLAFGSDWSVAPPTPLEGIYAATTRRTLDDVNPDGWVPEQKISVEDALRAYTINGAYAEFAEETKGSLEVGKLADFVVINKNLLEIPEDQIRDASIEATYVGGKKVYSKE